ncbi:MAG: hypothetical protein WD118_00945 [Phycisphaeraceae bacterium]
MARARSSGGGAATAWLIVILGIGFVVSLVLTIIFSTQVTALEQEAERARTALRVFVSSDLETAPAVVEMADRAGDSNVSVVQQLVDETQTLKALIGDQQLSTDQLEERVRERLDIEGGTLLRAVERLEANLDDARQQLASSESQREQANERAEQAQARADDQSSTYNEQVAELREQLQQVTDQFEGFQERVTQAESDLGDRIGQAQRSRQDRVAELEAELDSLATVRSDLQGRIRELERRADPLATPDIVRADGQVASVREEARRVHINLGRRENLVLGLTFEVYASGDLVRVGDGPRGEVRGLEVSSDVELPRGKATIEVVNIDEHTAVARVVRLARGATIDAGDQILNLVYDPDTRYRFYVYGEFDIDRLGEASEADRLRIESMVSRWNGQLADDLSHGVDYLVLGEEPEMPEDLPADEIDPVRVREHVEATRVFERYQELMATAAELDIPVLNQNRFLTLVGYYER